MSRPLAAFLILIVALTSIGLGSARGTARIGGEVVLCTGQDVVVTRLPADPDRSSAHLCPDMALSLMAAAAPPYAAVPDRAAMPQPIPPAALGSLTAAATRPVRVRGPPAGA